MNLQVQSLPCITQISLGRFHHFHLARELHKRGLLDCLYTGYPRFKLADEPGIPPERIRTFPWLQAPYMAHGRIGLDRWQWLNREWAWLAHVSLDLYVASQLNLPTVLIALSGSGLHAGRCCQQLGGVHICDRGSAHIRVQDQLLAEEYPRYGVRWPGIDPRSLAREEEEYSQADWISVPSQFCVDSFLAQGIHPSKILKIAYGARLERFKPLEESLPDKKALQSDKTWQESDNKKEFIVLFVGAAGPRKGFIDLLIAFRTLRHPHKRLIVIGSCSTEARSLLRSQDHESVELLGSVPNVDLPYYYSRASVMVIASIEEGLAMVIGEAMACACPVIASTNTGATELIQDGVEGFIVPIRSPQIIAERLEQLADQPRLREEMGRAALARVKQLGGWHQYGEQWAEAIHRMQIQ